MTVTVSGDQASQGLLNQVMISKTETDQLVAKGLTEYLPF